MMQNSPQFVIGFYAILRADAVVVPVNPMSRADELGHYIADPEAKVAICAADLGAHLAGGDAQLPPAQRLRAMLVTRYCDACRARSTRCTAHRKPGSSGSTPPRRCRPARMRWTDALAAGLKPGAHSQHRRRPGRAVLHLGHHRQGQGLHAHPRQPRPQHGGQRGVAGGTAADVSLGVLPMFHISGMQYAVHGPIWLGATIVVLPRWDRDLAGRLISHHRVTPGPTSRR